MGKVKGTILNTEEVTTPDDPITVGSGSIISDTVNSTQNNYDPTGYRSGGVVQIQVIEINCTSDSDMKGMEAPSPVESVRVTHINTGTKKLKYKKNQGAASVGNRYQMKNDFDVEKFGSVTWQYVVSELDWYMVANGVS